MADDEGGWETLSTGRSSNFGIESWAAQPDGGFKKLEKKASPPAKRPLQENGAQGPSMADIKAAGRARVKAAQEAQAAEEAMQAQAPTLWAQTFDFVFDSTTDPRVVDDFQIHGRTVLLIVPGFASWLSLTPAHVEKWNASNLLLESPTGPADRPACSLVFKWPCGEVRWTSENAQVEAAAAWQEAHEAAPAAARALTLVLQKLKARGCSVVVAAHSLGARVALQALANDLAAPRIEGLMLLGAAVDNHSLTGLTGTSSEINGVIFDGVGACPAEFPFNRMMKKCDLVALAHSASDGALTWLWPAAEAARCGRVAPAALGLSGLVEEELEEHVMDDESWMERVRLIDLTEEMGEGSHDPVEYVLTRSAKQTVRKYLGLI